jgi:hypothetical protein
MKPRTPELLYELASAPFSPPLYAAERAYTEERIEWDAFHLSALRWRWMKTFLQETRDRHAEALQNVASPSG